jgi:BlaI family transcriptional regulator, penicillinase repressor
MAKRSSDYLSPREQQIMELVYQRGRVSATELEEALPGSPSNSTVRTHLRLLEQRGHLSHVEEEGKFVYLPTRAKPNAAKSAMKRFLTTFVDGSVEEAFATLLSAKETKLTPEELDRLAKMIEDAKRREEI